MAGLAGEAARLLTESEEALVVPPGDPDALADALAALAATPTDVLLRMGQKGRAYYQRKLAYHRGVEQTLRLLEGGSSPRMRSPGPMTSSAQVKSSGSKP